MYDKDQYMHLWGCCEYFLAHAASGPSLTSFDLIRTTYQGKATSDAYIYERLTRPALARSAKGIKRFIRDYVERDRLGQLEGTARSLGESLKSHLVEDILLHLENALVHSFLRAVTHRESPEVLLSLTGVYHTYYKNKAETGMGLPPWFFSVFYPLAVRSRKGNLCKLEEWQEALRKRFLTSWKANESPGEKLAAFFEDEITGKITSYTLAGILGFMQEEKDKVEYLLEVTLRRSPEDTKYFQMMVANGLNALLEKQKRFAAAKTEIDTRQSVRIGVVSEDEIAAIVDTAVDAYFDPALDWCVQYHLSLAREHPRQKLAKQFEKTFLTMNREMWKELLILADTRRRVIFRTRHLLRVIIHYLFEARGIEREFWQKYIHSVDTVIHFAFTEDRERLREYNTRLGRQLSFYRNADKYQGTDWEGFYKDTLSRDMAREVIREIADKARSELDANLPAVWFSNQVDDGVDDKALYRFFRQGPDTA